MPLYFIALRQLCGSDLLHEGRSLKALSQFIHNVWFPSFVHFKDVSFITLSVKNVTLIKCDISSPYLTFLS